ncbi:MAG TPA: superinfection immunity protein [Streptosporangiaceae bacterium]|jgi:Superinfection immunity protein|nr:superinfection immunity protein [Streptosporangiaceae bacterium]
MVRAFLIITFLAALLMPLIIATLYKLPRQGAIAVLSLLFFWTGVGWVAAFFIAVGGAIRATRPSLVEQEQPTGSAAPAPAYSPAQTHAPGSPSERIQSPQRAQSPERAQPPRRSPWPDSPR